MGLPTTPVTFTVEQVAALNQKLSHMRHNVNNNLALIVAAVELLRRKPELAQKMADSIAAQPDKMNAEIQNFSAEFEKAFGITREKSVQEMFAGETGASARQGGANGTGA